MVRSRPGIVTRLPSRRSRNSGAPLRYARAAPHPGHESSKEMDARVKPGHDILKVSTGRSAWELLAGRADGGIVRGVGARRGVALRDLVDGERCSCQDRVAERQQNGQRHQRIEPEPESLVLHEVKRGQHPNIDVRQAVSRQRDIGDDREYLERNAPARVRKILQDTADECVAEKCKSLDTKPKLQKMYGPRR